MYSSIRTIAAAAVLSLGIAGASSFAAAPDTTMAGMGCCAMADHGAKGKALPIQ